MIILKRRKMHFAVSFRQFKSNEFGLSVRSRIGFPPQKCKAEKHRSVPSFLIGGFHGMIRPQLNCRLEV